MDEPPFLPLLLFLVFLILLSKGVHRVSLPGRYVEQRRLKRERKQAPEAKSIAGLPAATAVRLQGLALALAACVIPYLSGTRVGWISTPAASQAGESVLRQLVTTEATTYLEENSLVNLVVVAVADGEEDIVCVGRRSLPFGPPVNESTLFEIGSITKTFTGLLLAVQIEAGEVGLDEPVASLFPESVTVPGKTRQAITLRHLASHTSGLRGMPGSSSTEEEFLASLAATTLESEPGTESVYSNMGGAVLGYALSRASGSYEEAVRTEILAPLHMQQTAIRLDEGLGANVAHGYGSSIRVGPFMFARSAPPDPYVAEPFHGAGGLKSSPTDMMTYLKAQMGLASGPLKNAIERSHRELFRSPGSGGVGMFWLVPKEAGLIWHNGQTRGFHAFMGFSNDGRFGVVVLTATRRPLESLGLALLKQMRHQAQ